MKVKNGAYWIAVQAGEVPLAVGGPGTAKTQTNYAFAHAMGRSIYTLIGSLRDPADIGGYPYPSSIDSRSGERVFMRLVPPQWASQCHDGGKWLIFLDELTTVPPAVQAAMLRVIAERVVGDLALPSDTWISAAANPPEQAANGMELEPPMANRLVHCKWQFDIDAWRDGMANGLVFASPDFPRVGEDWQQKFLPTEAAMVSAFLRHRPGLLEAFPKDRAQQCSAWPSPRSWTAAARCLAAAKSARVEKGVELELVAGCVGEATAVEFATWRESLDLPDPEELLAGLIASTAKRGKFQYRKLDRPDKTIAMLGSVTAAVLANNTPDRWEAAMRLRELVAEHDFDLALAGVRPLAERVPSGAKLNPQFVAKFSPRLKAALL